MWPLGKTLLLAALFCLGPAAGAPLNCTLPALAVGQRLNSSKELNRFTKKHKHVLVGFSAATCANCCLFEPFYEQLLPLLPADVHWARVDTDRVEARGLTAAYGIEQLPAVVFFKQRKPTQLLEPHFPPIMAGFVRRALEPLPTAPHGSAALTAWRSLRTALRPPAVAGAATHGKAVQVRDEAEADSLLDGQQFVRVVARIGADEDADELEELTDAARHFASWPASFQFTSVTDMKAKQELASHALVKAACGSLGAAKRVLVVLALFDGEYIDRGRVGVGGVNQSILVRTPKAGVKGLVFNRSLVDGEKHSAEITLDVLPRVSCRTLDAYDGLSALQWVLSASLPPVGRFDTLTSGLYEQTRKPFLMLFVDTKRPELTSWLALLHKAHLQYNRAEDAGNDALKLMFVYIDGVNYLHRMPSLSLAADPERLPALSFNDVTERVLAWQPTAAEYRNGSAVLTADVLDSLIQRYLYGETEQMKERAAPKSLAVPKRAPQEKRNVPDLDSLSLEERLRFVTAVNQESFSEVVLDPAKDVVVYLYTSKGGAAETSKDRAIYVNRCAERFEELSISTVRIARIDLSEFTAPPSVQISEVPALVLFPAFAKEPPHTMYRGKFKVQHIMWWIEDHASRKFRLSELPHLDALESKAYWEQKGMLDPERQRRVAAENEGSARRKGRRSAPQRRGRRASAASEL